MMDWIASTNYGLLASLAGAIVFFMTSYYYYYENVYSFWSKKGVKGPRPFVIGGNMLSILFGNRFERERKWLKEYGKVYGFYENIKPALVIADVEVMRQICIKDFYAFVNHDSFSFSNKYQTQFLFALKDQHWKRVRSIMSPTFTSGKIKRMFKLLDVCADDLVLLFKEQLNGPSSTEQSQGVVEVNLKDLYGMYTMDAITTCCYGLKLERHGSTNLKMAATRNDFIRIAMKMFQLNFKRLLVMFLVNKRLLQWLNYEFLPEREMKPLAVRVEQLINSRRANKRNYDDYLQLLVDAKVGDKMELGEMDAKENHHAGLTQESLLRDQEQITSSLAGDQSISQDLKSMSNEEILSNATLLLVVGLETTASLLTFCTYTLAFHQQIQERLYQEIKAIADFDQEKGRLTFDYDALTSCQYLDSVLSETLRRFPAAIVTDRQAKEDYLIEKYNILIPKGTKLNLHLFLIMNDPDNWIEPEKFDPERFMPGNRDMIVPGSYCPFGLGPRHCVGMRFSLTEAKLAMAKMIMNFSFEPASGTSFPPQPKMNLGLNGIKRPLVNLKFRAT